MEKYAYVRVSSRDQNVDRQLLALQPFQIPSKNVFIDYQSGKDFKRPQYQKLMGRMQQGDLLVVKSIDRLGRNYNEILKNWQRITKDIGADICVIDMELLDTRKDTGNLTGTFITMGGSDYILVEFDYQADYSFIRNILEDCILSGLFPIIAHAERYEVFIKDLAMLDDFRKMGCMIQLNADSILGLDGGPAKRHCKHILKKGLADIVASDTHDTESRGNRLKDCRLYIEKKFGGETAGRLFVRNPERITESIELSAKSRKSR